ASGAACPHSASAPGAASASLRFRPGGECASAQRKSHDHPHRIPHRIKSSIRKITPALELPQAGDLPPRATIEGPMVYTCFEMIRDCRADLPQGWRHFAASYVPVIRRILKQYGSEGMDIDAILLPLRKPGAS